MMGKKIPTTHVHYNIQYPNITAELDIDLERFDGQYSAVQTWLDQRVLRDMEPYMPKQTGTFINVTQAMSRAIAGSGKVIAAAPPYGRFLYEGKVMVDERTGSPYARKGAKKVLVSQFSGKTNAKENIDFSRSTNTKATAKWFEKAKENYGDMWIRNVKKKAGGG